VNLSKDADPDIPILKEAKPSMRSCSSSAGHSHRPSPSSRAEQRILNCCRQPITLTIRSSGSQQPAPDPLRPCGIETLDELLELFKSEESPAKVD
jgi:hypothetical protein